MPLATDTVRPHPTEVALAIGRVGVESGKGAETRTILRLLAGGARPCEIELLKRDDFRLPASATLRCSPDLEVTVAVSRHHGWGTLDVRFRGDRAKDARRLLEEAPPDAARLFTRTAVRTARKALAARMSHAMSVADFRVLATHAFFEEVGLPTSLIHPSLR